MIKVSVCIGSSCHLKGSYDIAAAFEKAIKEYNLENKITLSGSFCIGKCNREGVSIQIDDEIFTGVTIDKFDAFFSEHILKTLNRGE